VGAVRDQVFGVDAVGSADEHFVAELPKTLTGKIRRIELRQLELQRSRQTVF
jgi:acyl-coenzyme A synthetase/AMP-(fatty) acid ligase